MGRDLGNTTTAVIISRRRKGQQLVFSVRRYADQIGLNLPTIHLILQIAIGHALSQLLLPLDYIDAKQIHHQAIGIG